MRRNGYKRKYVRLIYAGIKICLLSCIIGLVGCGSRSVILKDSDKIIIAPAGSVVIRPDGSREEVDFDGVVISVDELIE